MRWAPLAVALLVQAALLLCRLDRLPVWGDEQFTLDAIALPWGEIAEALRRDIHPPLYFALAKLWAALPLPGTEIERLRAFSALTMLGVTVALDRFVLEGREERVRRWTLALWALSPAVTLYGRMARSYALQGLLAVVALYFAKKLLEGPTGRRALTAGVTLAALLYTHYLPGLAVAGALAVAGVAYRQKAAAGVIAFAGASYLPWSLVLAEGMARAAGKSVYTLTASWLTEIPLRAAYAFVGLFLGEAHLAVTFAIAVVMGMGVAIALMRGWLAADTPTRLLLGVALLLGFLGAAQWVSFPFMPARLLWLLPWLTAMAVAGAMAWPGKLGRAGLALWLTLLAAGQALYIQRTGFLNKGYLIPFDEIAEKIADGVVLADATNCDPSPLRARHAAPLRFFAVASEGDVDRAMAATREEELVWRVRASRDVTAERIQDSLDRELEAAGFLPSETRLLPYSDLDRFLLRAAGDPDPPTHHLLLLEFRQRSPLRETR